MGCFRPVGSPGGVPDAPGSRAGLRSPVRCSVMFRFTPTEFTPPGSKDFQKMAIRIKARGSESVEQMLRRFKKLCEKEGLTKEVKKRQYYEKPSERRRRDSRKSAARVARVVR